MNWKRTGEALPLGNTSTIRYWLADSFQTVTHWDLRSEITTRSSRYRSSPSSVSCGDLRVFSYNPLISLTLTHLTRNLTLKTNSVISLHNTHGCHLTRVMRLVDKEQGFSRTMCLTSPDHVSKLQAFITWESERARRRWTVIPRSHWFCIKQTWETNLLPSFHRSSTSLLQ